MLAFSSAVLGLLLRRRQTIRGFLISKVLLAINYFHLAGQAYESRVKYPLETLVLCMHAACTRTPV